MVDDVCKVAMRLGVTVLHGCGSRKCAGAIPQLRMLFKRYGHSSGVRTPTSGSAQRQRWQPRSLRSGRCAIEAHRRSRACIGRSQSQGGGGSASPIRARKPGSSGMSSRSRLLIGNELPAIKGLIVPDRTAFRRRAIPSHPPDQSGGAKLQQNPEDRFD
jgi:hypothetical protein